MPVIDLIGADFRSEIFNGEHGTWNFTRLLEDCIRGKVGEVRSFDTAQAVWHLQKRTLDEAAIAGVEKGPKRWLAAIIMRVSDTQELIVDGSHRIMAWHRLGHKAFPAWWISPEDGRNYQVSILRDGQPATWAEVFGDA